MVEVKIDPTEDQKESLDLLNKVKENVMETEEKQWYLSKGVLGAAATILFTVLSMAKIDVDQGQITELVLNAGAVIGGVVALIGRLTAKKQLT